MKDNAEKLKALVLAFIRTAQSHNVSFTTGLAAAAQLIALISHKEGFNIDLVLDIVRDEYTALRNVTETAQQDAVTRVEEDDFVRNLIGDEDE